IKTHIDDMERADRIRNQNEREEVWAANRKINQIEDRQDDGKDKNRAKLVDNYEGVKGVEENVDGLSDEKADVLRNDRFDLQNKLNELEKNSRTFTEKIANTIGDEYPEGV